MKEWYALNPDHRLTFHDKLKGNLGESPYSQVIPLPTWVYTSPYLFAEAPGHRIVLSTDVDRIAFWGTRNHVDCVSFSSSRIHQRARVVPSMRHQITTYDVETGRSTTAGMYPSKRLLGVLPLCEVTYAILYMLHRDSGNVEAMKQLRLMRALHAPGRRAYRKIESYSESIIENLNELIPSSSLMLQDPAML